MQTDAARLRPMSVTDVLDTTFSLYRNNFALFAGVVAVLAIPETLINMVITAATSSTLTYNFNGSFDARVFARDVGAPVAAGGVEGVVAWIFGTLISGALALTIARRYLRRPITIPEAYSSPGAATYLKLFGATVVGFLAALIMLGLLAVLVTLATIGLVAVAPWLGIVFVVLAVIAIFAVLVFVALHFILVPQIIVLERSGVIRAYTRSWRLIQGVWWRTFGLIMLLYLMVGFVQGALGGAAAGVLSAIHPVLGTAISGVVGLVIQPVYLGALTLLYFDLRIRKEGFDLEYAAQSARAAAQAERAAFDS